MNKLSTQDLELGESRHDGQIVRELSDREIDQVAGGACSWFELGIGRIIHGSYPNHT